MPILVLMDTASAPFGRTSSASDGRPDGAPSRMAAVLAMDAAGYSRAMSVDERRTLVALAASRGVIDPAIRRHAGRIFSTGGDSVLAEFGTAEAAVRCAAAIQQALVRAVGAGTEVLSYRIGVHCGRVVPRGEDLLGETVNIAARLESLANPGGLCVSDTVLAELGRDHGFRVETMGLQPLKGIAQAVHVARIRLGEPSRSLGREGRLGVVVLPFRSARGDAHWGEGLADELTAALSRFSTLSVRARPPRRPGSAPDPRALAADLGVDYIVDGVLRVQRPRFRLSVQVIEAAAGTVVWSERISDRSDDLLDLEERLVDRVVGSLPGHLGRTRAEIAFAKRTESLDARDLYFQGLHHADRLDAASSRQALAIFERALAIDHDYAAALAMNALVRLRLWALEGSRGDLAPVAALAERAVALDPTDGWAHLVLGQIVMYRRELDAAEVHHKKASALNPYDARVLALRAPLATYLGKPEEGRGFIARAIAINPYHPPWYLTNLGLCHYCAGHYVEAEAAYLGVPRPQTGVLAGLVACRAQRGNHAGAAAAAEAVLAAQPDFSAEIFVAMRPFKFAHDRDHLRDGLRRGGLPA